MTVHIFMVHLCVEVEMYLYVSLQGAQCSANGNYGTMEKTLGQWQIICEISFSFFFFFCLQKIWYKEKFPPNCVNKFDISKTKADFGGLKGLYEVDNAEV